MAASAPRGRNGSARAAPRKRTTSRLRISGYDGEVAVKMNPGDPNVGCGDECVKKLVSSPLAFTLFRSLRTRRRGTPRALLCRDGFHYGTWCTATGKGGRRGGNRVPDEAVNIGVFKILRRRQSDITNDVAASSQQLLRVRELGPLQEEA